MNLTLPLFADLDLTISAEPDGRSGYPTAPLQKGLLLRYRGQNLAEEAVGFGLPVLKYGLQALFPGSVALTSLHEGPHWSMRVVYTLNLVERILGRKSTALKGQAFYTAKDYFAALLRHVPALRKPLTTLSSAARRTFGWETIYEPAGLNAEIRLLYTFDPDSGILQVKLEPDSLLLQSATELVLMDEQGARFFDRYEEPSGFSLSGEAIGCWDEVHAMQACFASSTLGIRFTVSQSDGSRMFRGRELIGSRLAWAGFGHVLPFPLQSFEYSLRLEKFS